MKFADYSFKEAPQIKISPPGPKSQHYLKFQSSYEGSAVSYPRGMPMALRRAKGATVEDVDSNIYIDFFGGAGVMNVGHSNAKVIEAAERQIKDLTHALDVPFPARRELVETLLSILPDELNRVFFGGPTGSDAVEAAVKLARYNTRRFPMIAFEGSYHGMTAGALSLTSGLSFKEDFLPLIPEVHFVPYAYCYRCAFNKEPGKCDLECAKYIEHILDDPHSGVGKPAAIIIESIQGEGGSIVPPEEFVSRIRDICDKHEIIMIADEIQAGLCRTGKMFAFQHSKIKPDIITLSKGLGGVGFPLSCIAYKERFDKWPPAKHIGTFRGNVIAFAAGAAALNFMVQNKLADHAKNLGQEMLAMLDELKRDSSVVGDVRGKGLMIGVELVRNKETKKPAPDLAKKIRSVCHAHGLLIEIGGHYSNVARFLPPLVLSRELARKGIEIFMDSVREKEKSL
ncbi:MAG: aspartate aminotransferase family protein [Candidatus Aminicenantes bacterium]